jgi:hypothetical protein
MQSQLGIRIHRQVDDLHPTQSWPDLCCGINPVQNGHSNIDQDRIGLELQGGAYQICTTCKDAYDIEFWFEQLLT